MIAEQIIDAIKSTFEPKFCPTGLLSDQSGFQSLTDKWFASLQGLAYTALRHFGIPTFIQVRLAWAGVPL